MMGLTAGARLGPYEILTPLGAGGMGEVYKARDTRLDRLVALKILPAEFSSDPARRARFAREAKTISQLSHSNICTLFDVGEADLPSTEPRVPSTVSVSVGFLVMEFLEGQTLAQRLAKGRLPPDEALRIGAEIADALAAAHRHGVIHRDLKPTNIMLARSGGPSGPPTVKLLDFGLAKVRDQAIVADESAGPTETESITNEGTLVGTLPYMAPEQVEGMPADARTDIWALGCVLYEMVTGSRAFAGDSQASLVAAIMSHAPQALTDAQPLTPPGLERLVRRCLMKAPDDRWDTAHDLAEELRWIERAADAVASDLPKRAGRSDLGRRHRTALVVVVASTAIVAALIGGWAARFVFSTPPAVVSGPTRVELSLAPADMRADGWSTGGVRTSLALSGDGRTLVFHGHVDRWAGLFVKSVDEDDAVRLDGTEEGYNPVFSPDDRWIAYWTEGEIRKVPVSGGPSARVCDTGTLIAPPYGISWGDDGNLVYAVETGGLWQVPSGGGIPRLVTTLHDGEISHRLPHVLPGGTAVLFTTRSTRFVWGHEQIVVEHLDTHERRVILDHGADARFVPPGYVVFMDLGRLAGMPFDPERLEPTGPPVVLVPDVAQAVNERNTGSDSGAGQWSLSRSGDLAYVFSPGGVAPLSRATLAWVDRRGTVTPVDMPEKALVNVSLAPDGQRAALSVYESTRLDAWLYDLVRGTWTRLTEGAEAWRTVWSPDGKELMLVMGDGRTIRQPLRVGGMADEVIAAASGAPTLSSWSKNDALAFVQGGDFAHTDIFALDLHHTHPVLRPFVSSGAAEVFPEFSPDGRWLAYASRETGRLEVYVQAYPGPGERIQVTTDGGSNPRWNPNGRELFYASPRDPESGRRWLRAVEVAQKGNSLEIGRAQALFPWSDDLTLGSVLNIYTVALDGQRFLTTRYSPRLTPAVTHVRLVQNWFEVLKAKVRGG